MKRIGLLALALALTATLAACSSTAEINPNPSAPAVEPTASAQPGTSPNTVTKGLDRAARDVGDMAQGAADDVSRMARNGETAIQNRTW